MLDGPSVSGAIQGDYVAREVKVGIVVVPAGVPHGWTGIADHVDHLGIRPDPEKVLRAGYVQPVIEEMRR